MQVIAGRDRQAPAPGAPSGPGEAQELPPAQAHNAVSGRYLPALDGLRAVAVGAVIAYHLQYGWAAGGYLGVDLFFVLSGFLITGLLVEERALVGSIRLGGFWIRRAKRLLPGLLLMLVALSAYVGVRGPGLGQSLQQLRGDALATIFYFANWHLLFANQSYFAQFGSPSPLQHTWSLAIEEQFYLLWPIVLVLLLGLHRAAKHRSLRRSDLLRRRAALAFTVFGAAASAGWMALLTMHGASVNRLYYGTDSRAFDLLVGASLALLVATKPQPGVTARRCLHALGVVGAAAMGFFFWRAGGASGSPPRWMFEGGFLLCALSAGSVIADVRQDSAGPLGIFLKLRPVRWVGKISYGLYLWHWPVIVELTSASTGLSGIELTLVRLAVTFAAATASFYLVERPLRRASFSGLPRAARFAMVPSAMGLAAVVTVVATLPAAASATSPSVRLSSSASVPGAGRLSAEKPIRIPAGTAVSRDQPLRVTLIGDSVMFVDGPAVEAALQSTRAVDVDDRAFPGWGLSTDKNWPQDVLNLIDAARPQVVVAMWSWDNNIAVADPSGYKAELEHFVRVILTPGDGVDGVVFQQFPVEGPVIGDVNPAQERSQTAARSTGVVEWNSLVASLPKVFPGKVMYFPIGSAIELDGHFATWLPPPGTKHAPKDHWVRVRMLDDVHLCPAGAARYANALLADMTDVFHLPSAAPGWSTGTWTNDPRYRTNSLFSTPCPDDHPGS